MLYAVANGMCVEISGIRSGNLYGISSYIDPMLDYVKVCRLFPE